MWFLNSHIFCSSFSFNTLVCHSAWVYAGETLNVSVCFWQRNFMYFIGFELLRNVICCDHVYIAGLVVLSQWKSGPNDSCNWLKVDTRGFVREFYKASVRMPLLAYDWLVKHSNLRIFQEPSNSVTQRNHE